jgi:hypothetical protein
MSVLPDVNVLIAIAWPTHVHHSAAIKWFDASADSGWATAPPTEAGFLRLSMNPAVVGRPVQAREATALMRELRMVGAHRFWTDDTDALSLDREADRIQGYRQITDVHLLNIARRNAGSVATLDGGFVGITDEPATVTLISTNVD